MLGSNTRVIESGGNGVRRVHLSGFILQEVTQRSVQNAGPSARERCRVMSGVESFAGRFDADELHVAVVDERVKRTHRVRAAADARDDGLWQLSDALHELRLRLTANDRLEVANHAGIWRRPDHRSDDVI